MTTPKVESPKTESPRRERAGSLTFPADPLAAMRELSDLDAPALSEVPAINGHTPLDPSSVDTETRKPVSTELRTDGSKDLREQGSTEGLTGARKHGSAEASPALREDASTHTRKRGSKPASPDVGKPASMGAAPDTILERVEAALASREPLLGGVKATVDMSPELSSRAKRYLADHRGQNSRQVIVALLDAFLSEKGY